MLIAYGKTFFKERSAFIQRDNVDLATVGDHSLSGLFAQPKGTLEVDAQHPIEL